MRVDIQKKISFQRLPIKDVTAYEVYGIFKDDTYTSGTKTELIDTIENIAEPNTELTRIKLDYNADASWELPKDAYLDRDHQFRLYLNDVPLSVMYYSYNRLSRKFSLDIYLKSYESTDIIELEYYKDRIVKYYDFTEDCKMYIKPIFKESSNYGKHNVIV